MTEDQRRPSPPQVIPFGKYIGQPVEVLRNDPQPRGMVLKGDRAHPERAPPPDRGSILRYSFSASSTFIFASSSHIRSKMPRRYL
jgi:hypothetical protein